MLKLNHGPGLVVVSSQKAKCVCTRVCRTLALLVASSRCTCATTCAGSPQTPLQPLSVLGLSAHDHSPAACAASLPTMLSPTLTFALCPPPCLCLLPLVPCPSCHLPTSHTQDYMASHLFLCLQVSFLFVCFLQ